MIQEYHLIFLLTKELNTGGNNYILQNNSFHFVLRKHFFSARIINIWNSLPDSVIDACTVNAFKAHLDK